MSASLNKILTILCIYVVLKLSSQKAIYSSLIILISQPRQLRLTFT